MTLRPAQPPGSDAAIDVSEGIRRFTGRWVADGLMLANLPFTREHVVALSGQGVDLVLNMCEDREYREGQRGAVEAAYLETGIEEDRAFPVRDFADHPPGLLDAAVARIEAATSAGRNVAVHCRGGIERSATVAAAVLVRRDELSVEDALRRLRAIAPTSAPLPGQRAALERWAER